MKKSVIIIGVSLFILIIAIIGVIKYFMGSTPVNVSKEADAYAVFKYDDLKDIYEKLTVEETQQVTEILDGNVAYYDSPACGFDDNIGFIIGNKRFSVACDGSPTIKYGGKFFLIDESQIDIIHRIMIRHGAFFPCV